MQEQVHPYFMEKAEAVMRRAGGDPAVAGPLAAWAQQAKGQDQTTGGVIVGRDGTILAAYEQVQEGPLCTLRVTREDERRWGLGGTSVLDLATAMIGRKAGQPVICVGASEVTMGAGTWASR